MMPCCLLCAPFVHLAFTSADLPIQAAVHAMIAHTYTPIIIMCAFSSGNGIMSIYYQQLLHHKDNDDDVDSVKFHRFAAHNDAQTHAGHMTVIQLHPQSRIAWTVMAHQTASRAHSHLISP